MGGNDSGAFIVQRRKRLALFSLRLPQRILEGLQLLALREQQFFLNLKEPFRALYLLLHRNRPENSQPENRSMKIVKISSDRKYKSIKPPPTTKGIETK